jgi:predicted HTH domain antitoxin
MNDRKGKMMAEISFEVRLPSDLLQFGYDQARVQRNVKEWLVLSLFTDGEISSGKAARLLGISRIEFLNLLRRRGIAYVDYSSQELEEEFEAVETLEIHARK